MIHELVKTLSVQAPLQKIECLTDPVQGNWLSPQEPDIVLPRVLEVAPHPPPRKGSFLLVLRIELYGYGGRDP